MSDARAAMVPIRELDVVALTCDLPNDGLTLGQVGTVVHVHSSEAFEVEFLDNNGHVYALTTLRARAIACTFRIPLFPAPRRSAAAGSAVFIPTCSCEIDALIARQMSEPA